MSAEMPFRREAKFPQGVILLADAQNVERDVLKELRMSKGKDVRFGITYEVLKESLKQKDLPLNATISKLEGRFSANPKDTLDNIFILEGEARIGKKDIPFGVALGNDNGKIAVKGLRLNSIARMLVKPLLSDIDGIIKKEINRNISSVGEVAACSIGNGVLECTIMRKEGGVIKSSVMLR